MIEDLRINEERKAEYYRLGYWSEKTLADAWEEAAERFGARTYVKDDGGVSFTYREVDEKASRLASWLKDQGVSNGDVVSFQIPKWSEFAIVYAACLKVGAVMHPIPVNFNAEDLDYVLNHVGTKVYVCPTFYHKTDYERQFEESSGRFPGVEAVLLVDREMAPHPGSPYATLAQATASRPPLDAPSPSASDEVACILSTSGTTGRPKAALLTHNNILFSERSYAKRLGLTCEDVVWMPSPLNHATGFFHGLLCPMLVGGSTVLEQHFDAAEAIALINEEGCTWSTGATPFVHDLIEEMESSGAKVPTLKTFVCGGAPVPPSLVAKAREHGIALCECYGSTESCPHLSVPAEKCEEWNGAWSGIPFPGIEVRVVDAERRQVPNGVDGEECSRGPHQFVGYLNDKERTDKALDDEGWFYSGDLCRMDDLGRVHITGRIKEIIIRGGENISANEIDHNLDGCPGIGDHATVGMPDERLGERICTFVVPAPGPEPTLEAVRRYLSSKGVQKRLWPERIEPTSEIPRTKTGKVKRHLLTEELKDRMEKEGQE